MRIFDYGNDNDNDNDRKPSPNICTVVLVERTHTYDAEVFDRTIDVLVLRLRRKIEPNPQAPKLIRTERGAGYVFDVDVDTA